MKRSFGVKESVKQHIQRPCGSRKCPVAWAWGMSKGTVWDEDAEVGKNKTPQDFGARPKICSLSRKRFRVLKKRETWSRCFEELSGCVVGSRHAGPKRRLLRWPRWSQNWTQILFSFKCFSWAFSKWAGTFFVIVFKWKWGLEERFCPGYIIYSNVRKKVECECFDSHPPTHPHDMWHATQLIHRSK
jgi:hypothetical protein